MPPQATFCAALVDEWVRAGVGHAVVAPGSRSTPMALALADRAEVSLHVFHDERSAAFAALGIGAATGLPAVLLCTSGTAAANFTPAVVEAGLSEVPVIVLTADRPPELRDVGAPQTIDQTLLFGRAVRWFHDPGVPVTEAGGSWRSLAARAFIAATGQPCGPVHLNLPFRDPLVGAPDELPPGRGGGAPWTAHPPPAEGQDVSAAVGIMLGRRGVIVAGARGAVAADLRALAKATGWACLADATSEGRAVNGAICAFDSLLRDERFASRAIPEVILRVGRPPASKVLAGWTETSGATVVQVGGAGVVDPDHRVALRLGSPDSACRALASALAGRTVPTVPEWSPAEALAQAAIDEVLATSVSMCEPAVARAVTGWSSATGNRLVLASSMPIRDAEWFGVAARAAHANRGANGIDGTVSTAVGVALATGHPVGVLVGDIAFVHDASALVALGRRAADVRVVVVDNDGGGIFSFLAQASELPSERFEALFGTPHGTDVAMLAQAHGLPTALATTTAELLDALAEPGPRVITVRTDRAHNVEAHAALHAAVAAAVAVA